ncbi:MAG: hypothetical protein AAGA23_05155 [Pseudomonadota bacterium]
MKFLLWIAVLAQNPSLGELSQTRSVIPGGGGTSSGGDYTLTATVGQAAARSASGGGFTLNGGFWGSPYGEAAVFLDGFEG